MRRDQLVVPPAARRRHLREVARQHAAGFSVRGEDAAGDYPRIEAAGRARTIRRFLAQTDGLAEKRGPILVQLPPSLSFDGSVVTAFLDMVRKVYDGPIVCEPRHATWFSPAVASLLDRYGISRVAADPPPVPGDDQPGGLAARGVFPAARVAADLLVTI